MSGITAYLTHTSTGTKGSTVTLNCYRISENLVVFGGVATVTATISTNNNNVKMSISGITPIQYNLNGYAGGDSASYLMYNGGYADAYIYVPNTGSKTLYVRIFGIGTLS